MAAKKKKAAVGKRQSGESPTLKKDVPPSPNPIVAKLHLLPEGNEHAAALKNAARQIREGAITISLHGPRLHKGNTRVRAAAWLIEMLATAVTTGWVFAEEDAFRIDEMAALLRGGKPGERDTIRALHACVTQVLSMRHELEGKVAGDWTYGLGRILIDAAAEVDPAFGGLDIEIARKLVRKKPGGAVDAFLRHADAKMGADQVDRHKLINKVTKKKKS